MSESIHSTVTPSQSEIIIHNLQAAGYSEEDIRYELDGYGSVQALSRMLGDETGGTLPSTAK